MVAGRSGEMAKSLTLFSSMNLGTLSPRQQTYAISKWIFSAYLYILPDKPKILSFICKLSAEECSSASDCVLSHSTYVCLAYFVSNIVAGPE